MPESEANPAEVAEFQRLYPIKPKEAMEQAAEYLGFMAGIEIDLGGGETWTLPNPSLMDDETEDRYNQALIELQEQVELLDRGPDVTEPDTVDDDGNVVPGKFIRKGDILSPERIDGELVPNQSVVIAKALMGDEVYAKFKKAGGRASQITIHWQQMGKFMREREAADSKSTSSPGVVAPVSDGTGV